MSSPRLPRFKRANNPTPIELTERDHKIIRLVHKHRFLRSSHILNLLGGSPQSLLRRLQLLYHHGFLERPRAQLEYYHQGGSRQIIYLNSANETTREKERLLMVQQEELQRVQKEIQRTYDLYQQEKLDADGFAKFYRPLDERRKELEMDVPKLEAQVAMMKVADISAEEIASQASSLYDHWQTMEAEQKRELVEIIAEKIIIDTDEITIKLCHTPSCKDMAKGWRKGRDSNPR